MKKALIFVVGALGLLAFSNYKKSRAGARTAEQRVEGVARPGARKMRLRHRTEDGLLDLNSATLIELKELEGIDDAFAARIVDAAWKARRLCLVAAGPRPEFDAERLRRVAAVCGYAARGPVGPPLGGGSLGTAKCADTSKVDMSSVARMRVKLELRWSNEYCAR